MYLLGPNVAYKHATVYTVQAARANPLERPLRKKREKGIRGFASLSDQDEYQRQEGRYLRSYNKSTARALLYWSMR
jgi:hypothetical protein